MSNPPDVPRILNLCMQHITDANKLMPHDMYNAAMRLGTAEMMLASASHAVHKHAGLPTRSASEEEPSAEGL